MKMDGRHSCILGSEATYNGDILLDQLYYDQEDHLKLYSSISDWYACASCQDREHICYVSILYSCLSNMTIRCRYTLQYAYRGSA